MTAMTPMNLRRTQSVPLLCHRSLHGSMRLRMRFRMLSPPPAQLGFTLIELLIALGVMAIFALLAYRGLDSVLRLHQGAYAHEQQAQAIDRVITQIDADLRQASSVALLAPATSAAFADGAAPALRLSLTRRIDTELATVEWLLGGERGTTLQRRATSPSGVQTADLLADVTALEWLRFSPVSASTPSAEWQTASLAQVLAQPNQRLDTPRGLGLRLTAAGKPLEKLFLVGR
jgi:prepilin-type N-terminal cleavage/methylation domain-containing protein